MDEERQTLKAELIKRSFTGYYKETIPGCG